MTKDLTKIKKPFGLLSEKTQNALKKASHEGKDIQMFDGMEWVTVGHILLYDMTYRLKPMSEVVTRPE